VSISDGFVGRREELRELEFRLAEASLGHPQVVLIEADAGAGKSTLLSSFLGTHVDALILRASGEESESLLSYGVVDQLRSGVVADPSADPMAVGAELVALFDQLQSEDRVVVISIDDLHWADRSSARALLFALRRLRGDKVLTIVCARVDEVTDPGWVRFIGGDDRVTRVRLGGLNPDELVELASTLGLGVLSRRGAARLATHTGGNALYSRALLEEIGVAGLTGEDASLPAPRQLSGVVLSRMASLSIPTQNLLAAAAVLGQHAPASTIASVAEILAPQAQIEEAESAGLLDEKSVASELSFAHPLYRAAIYADLNPTTRRELHLRAANFTEGQTKLAHRVAASLGSDESLAQDFEESASAARASGELGMAAWALKQAAFLSPVSADRERRLLDAVVALLDSADTAAAGEVLALCQQSSARRDALAGLHDVLTGSPSAEARLLSAWTTHDRDSEVQIGARAATSLTNLMVIHGRPDEALIWAQRAIDATVPSSELRSMAVTGQAYGFAAAGRSDEGLEALSFLPEVGSQVAETDALIMRGMLKVYTDDLPGAIVDLGLAAARLHIGLPATYPGPCLSHLSDAHFRRGNWDAAVTYAQLAVARAQDADRPLDLARAHARGAEVYSSQGQWSLAQTHSSAAREAADRFPQVLPVANATMAAVSIAAAREDFEGVLAATESLRATGLLDVGGRPGIFNWRATEVDALIGQGELVDAAFAVDEFESAIPVGGLPSAQLSIARCRGNLAVARHDATTADEAFSMAHTLSTSVLMPFQQALLNLHDGRRLRAFEEGSRAVERLEAAHHVFSELGADPYVQFCATELDALHIKATPVGAATRLGLTRAELAVARLVATGMTNKEVAGELFVSIKTVEYHLRNSYMKLNISSRRALAALLT
jgi:DNA-binding CsgD family transcriptional regulator/tetratricopeptide (TPR) repeat protein